MLIKHDENSFTMYDDETVVGYLKYEDKDGIWHLTSTFTYPAFRGKAYASKILAHTVDYMRKHNIKAIPVCSYVVNKFDAGGYEDIDAR